MECTSNGVLYIYSVSSRCEQSNGPFEIFFATRLGAYGVHLMPILNIYIIVSAAHEIFAISDSISSWLLGKLTVLLMLYSSII